MLGEVLIRRRAPFVRVLCFSSFVALGAAAAVTQPPPDSTPLPQPVPTPELTVIVSRSFPESAVTLQGLFQFRSESIDASADAVADPGTFRPLCDGADSDVTAEFVLHGGGCTTALAWYNVTGAAPASSELYTMIPTSVATDMACTIADFCPLASAPSTIFTWVPHVYAGNVCNDPRYTGGDIAFAIIGNPTGPCTATKYSEREANVVCTSCTPNTPWITSLVYRSSLRSDAYYLAFEDLPMSPTDWRAVTTSAFAPDGDFNDFVFHLTGVCHGDDECARGGNGTGGSGGSSGSDAGGSENGGSGNGASSNGGNGNGGSNGGSSTGGDDNGGTGLTGGTDTGGSDTSGAAGLGEGGDGTSGSSPGSCVPGREVACTCTNGSEGSQRCLADGRGFEACTCGDDDDDDDEQSTGGCGCRHAAPGETGFWAFAAMALVALRRRFVRRVSG
jgi:MYXO-CTERM domain-containing protein